MAKIDACEKPPTTCPCPVQVVGFGAAIVLAAIRGELCVDYPLRLKRQLAGLAAV
ncbi:MAG: hypothetical protein JNK23_15375 [Opitutaceae bacterium]|nr:hypothetical protein [Opitutaceae bacterium]